jgi:prepilin-type N-terminal cleavage/methylation domain-containing protein
MKNPRPGRGRRGFSLIEMLVVMAIMLALVALGIPALQLALHESKMRGFATEITVLMRQARIDAIKTSAQAVVQIVPSTGADGDTGHVQAFSDRNSNGMLDAGEPVLASFPLPTGVTFTDCAGLTNKDSVDSLSVDPLGGPNIAIFQSGGSIAAIGGFRFGDPYGNDMEVHVEPAATAKIQVRKCQAGVYVVNNDNEKAWTWN